MFVIIIGAIILPLYVRKPRHREVKTSCPKLHSYEIKSQDPTQLAGLQSLHFLGGVLLGFSRCGAEAPTALGSVKVRGHPARPLQTPGSLTECFRAGYSTQNSRGGHPAFSAIPPWAGGLGRKRSGESGRCQFPGLEPEPIDLGPLGPQPWSVKGHLLRPTA